MRIKSLILALVLVLAATTAMAQTLTVDIYGPGQRKINMVVLPPQGLGGPLPAELPEQFSSLLRQNLEMLPFLHLASSTELLGGNPASGVGLADIDFKPLRLAKVDLVMTTGWNGENVELRVFETFSRNRLIGKAYRDLDSEVLPRVVDRFCSHFMRALTGKYGFFESTLAFVKRGEDGKELYTVGPQGRGLKPITDIGGFNTSPNWSKDGKKLVFTHIASDGHRMGVWIRDTGMVKLKRFAGDTVISPAFDAEGMIAVTMDRRGNPDIFLMNEDFEIEDSLAASWAIEVSPGFDRTGRLMVFASGRAGNPHIFLLDRETGKVRRITYDGKYNTNPSLSPDGRYIVFNRQTSQGHKIFLHDTRTGMEKQLTHGPGNDEDPAFGPDGYFVAFSSDRGGKGYRIYLTTRHGDTPRLIPTGEGSATMPAWDTANRF